MAIKWYGFWRSLASCRVRIALALKGLQAEEISINLAKVDDDHLKGSLMDSFEAKASRRKE